MALNLYHVGGQTTIRHPATFSDIKELLGLSSAAIYDRDGSGNKTGAAHTAGSLAAVAPGSDLIVEAVVQNATAVSRAEFESLSRTVKYTSMRVEIFNLIIPNARIFWNPSKLSREDNAPFKQALIDYWRVNTSRKRIQCQITGIMLPRGQVRASHILPHSCSLSLPLFGLATDDINDPRNGLLLCEEIEQAFDNLEVCFVWANPQIRFIVLDKRKLWNQPVAQSTTITFGNVHNKSLITNGQTLCRRLLGYHAWVAHDLALERGWIQREDWEDFEVFHDLSVGALEEGEERPDWARHLDQILHRHQDE